MLYANPEEVNRTYLPFSNGKIFVIDTIFFNSVTFFSVLDLSVILGLRDKKELTKLVTKNLVEMKRIVSFQTDCVDEQFIERSYAKYAILQSSLNKTDKENLLSFIDRISDENEKENENRMHESMRRNNKFFTLYYIPVESDKTEKLLTYRDNDNLFFSLKDTVNIFKCDVFANNLKLIAQHNELTIYAIPPFVDVDTVDVNECLFVTENIFYSLMGHAAIRNELIERIDIFVDQNIIIPFKQQSNQQSEN